MRSQSIQMSVEHNTLNPIVLVAYIDCHCIILNNNSDTIAHCLTLLATVDGFESLLVHYMVHIFDLSNITYTNLIIC